jgi:predicted small lipoprotein YifL
MKTMLKLAGWLLPVLIATGVAACEKQGPMEKAGEKMDEAVEQATQSMSEAQGEIGEGLEEAGKKMQQ